MKPVLVDVKSKYEIYLESPEFDKLRQATLERDHHKCVVCGTTENLRIHHLTYLHIYHEDLRDLITICDKCHSIYHNIDNRRKALLEMLQGEQDEEREQTRQKMEQQAEECRRKYEDEKRERIEKRDAIFEEVKRVYGPQDYARNGDLDMCAWPILNRVINSILKKYNMDYYPGKKDEIQRWFFYRRMEFFKKCIDQGFTINQVVNNSKFPLSYLNKYYRAGIVEAKLKEEETLNQLNDKEE